jgi:hypothetical protein
MFKFIYEQYFKHVLDEIKTYKTWVVQRTMNKEVN